MKYFTAQLWADINSPNSNSAAKQWDENVENYREALTAILPKMNPHARRFFRDMSLHDGTLTLTELGDRIDDTDGNWQRGDVKHRKTDVRLRVLSAEGDFIFTLQYKKVTRVEVRFPGEVLFPAGRWPNFGDWGYDELAEVEEGIFRHEVLFSSGATILIEFARFSFKRSPAREIVPRRKKSSG